VTKELRLLHFFHYYDKGNPYHRAAISQLEEAMDDALLNRNADWFKTWSQGGFVKQEKLKEDEIS